MSDTLRIGAAHGYSASGIGGAPDSLSLSFLVACTTSSTLNNILAAYAKQDVSPMLSQGI